MFAIRYTQTANSQGLTLEYMMRQAVWLDFLSPTIYPLNHLTRLFGMGRMKMGEYYQSAFAILIVIARSEAKTQ